MDANSTVSRGQADNIDGRAQEITEQQELTGRKHGLHTGTRAQHHQTA